MWHAGAKDWHIWNNTVQQAGGSKGEQTRRNSFCPLLLNGQVPFPGEMVVVIIIGKEGLVAIVSSSHQALGCLLEWCHEFIFLWPWPIAAHHECSFVH